MSEATIRASLKTKLEALTTFDVGDVVIEDWAVLDQTNTSAPYARIGIAELVEVQQGSMDGPTYIWPIPVALLVRFTDWPESRLELATTRQAVLEALIGDGSNLDASGDALVATVRAVAPPYEVYDRYLTTEQIPEALPIFLGQDLLVTVRERTCY